MPIAAFLITMACTLSPGAATDDCQKFETQKWEAPTTADLATCADLAEQLTNLNKPSTCEVVPMAAEPVASAFRKGPRHALNGQALTNRELADQRGAGQPQPRAQIVRPVVVTPTQYGFMY